MWFQIITRTHVNELFSCSLLEVSWFPVSYLNIIHFELFFFCEWHKIAIKFHSPTYDHPVFLAPFPAETVFSPLSIFGSLVKYYFTIYVWVYFCALKIGLFFWKYLLLKTNRTHIHEIHETHKTVAVWEIVLKGLMHLYSPAPGPSIEAAYRGTPRLCVAEAHLFVLEHSPKRRASDLTHSQGPAGVLSRDGLWLICLFPAGSTFFFFPSSHHLCAVHVPCSSQLAPSSRHPSAILQSTISSQRELLHKSGALVLCLDLLLEGSSRQWCRKSLNLPPIATHGTISAKKKIWKLTEQILHIRQMWKKP